jgi:uncharacterized protein YaaW (UPF0174 family)
MHDTRDGLIEQIQKLQKDLARETQTKESLFCYSQHNGKVRFDAAATARHRGLRMGFGTYLLHSRFLVLLTAPVIWMCAFPIALADLIGTLY